MLNLQNRRVIFIRIGWMEYYGYIPGFAEVPIGGGSFNQEEVGSESNNFAMDGIFFYGYVKTGANSAGFNLKKIDPNITDVSSLDNTLVIMFSTNPVEGQQRIIGWYQDAEVYDELVDDSYNIKAKPESSVLLPTEERYFPIPKGKDATGQSNTSYIYNDQQKLKQTDWLEKAIDYVDNYSGPNLIKESKIGYYSDSVFIESVQEDAKLYFDEFTAVQLSIEKNYQYTNTTIKNNIKVFLLDTEFRKHFNNQSYSNLLDTIKTLLNLYGLKKIHLTAFCSNKKYFIETGLLSLLQNNTKSIQFRFLFPIPQGISKNFAEELIQYKSDGVLLKQFGKEYSHTRVHSKVLIAEFENYCLSIVGSSNATGAGLLSNIEYNVLFKTTTKEENNPLEWFNYYWNSSEDLDPNQFLEDSVLQEDSKEIEVSKKELLPFQVEAQKALTSNIIQKESEVGFLVLPTGAGKTFTTLDWIFKNIFSDKNKKVLWISHRYELLLQASTEAKSVKKIQNKIEIVINEVFGRAAYLRNIFDGNLIFTSNIVAYRYLKDFQCLTFDLVVIDEAHRSSESTKYYGNVLKGLKYKTLLGLTATPYRGSELDQENLDRVFHKNMFYQKIREELKNNCSLTNQKQLFSKPVLEQIETNYTTDFLDNELQFQGQIYKFNNPTRNKKIVDTYFKYRDKFKRAIIFAVDTHHANELAKLINQNYPKECQSFHNGDIPLDSRALEFANQTTNKMSLFDRTKIINMFKKGEIKVLSTVQLLIEGFDEPKIDALFMACPTYSTLKLVQMLGRGLRGPAVGGTEKCLIFDFVDQVKFHSQKNIKLQRVDSINLDKYDDYFITPDSTTSISLINKQTTTFNSTPPINQPTVDAVKSMIDNIYQCNAVFRSIQYPSKWFISLYKNNSKQKLVEHKVEVLKFIQQKLNFPGIKELEILETSVTP